jgi:GntR family transcriptional regulator
MPDKDDKARKGHKEVAATIRHRIVDEQRYLPGTPLPSEPTIAKQEGVHVNTVRQAFALLRLEGLIITEPNRGSYVRPTLPVVTLRTQRYLIALTVALGLRPAPLLPPSANIRVDIHQEEATADHQLAELFGVPEWTPLVLRRSITHMFGRPWAAIHSYLPADLVTEAGLPEPGGTWDGGPESVFAELVSIGKVPTKVRDIIRARMPSADEVERLSIVGVDPLFIITRMVWAGDRVVEVARDIAYHGSQVEMQVDVDLTGVGA